MSANRLREEKLYVQNVGKINERQPSFKRYGGLHIWLFLIQNPDGLWFPGFYCYEFDLEKPIWLDSTVKEFKYHDKARFTQDNFIESVDFDFLEIQVIEE